MMHFSTLKSWTAPQFVVWDANASDSLSSLPHETGSEYRACWREYKQSTTHICLELNGDFVVDYHIQLGFDKMKMLTLVLVCAIIRQYGTLGASLQGFGSSEWTDIPGNL